MYREALYRLLTDERFGYEPEGFAREEIAVLSRRSGKEALLVVAHRDASDDAAVELTEHLKKIRSQLKTQLSLLVVGAGGDELARRSKPLVTHRRQGWVAQDEHGTVVGDDDTELGQLLRELVDQRSRGALPQRTPEEWEPVAARLDKRRAEAEAAVGQAQSFQKAQKANPPRVTYAMLAAIGVGFALQFLFGGTNSLPALVRLGAMVPERVLDGEVYRLLTVSLLHGSVQHVLFNGLVLFALGRFVEGIIGSVRFTLLLFASVVGGSLAGLVFAIGSGELGTFSVGASGGGWGLLAAHAVLAYRPQGLLPSSMIPGARKAALTNLVLNVIVSFLPNVDWVAHFGGGLVGAALVFFVLRRGLPTLADRSAEAEMEPVPAPGVGVKAGAALMVALMLASVAAVALVGRPQVLLQAPVWTEIFDDDLGYRYPMPEQMPRNPELRLTEGGGRGFGATKAGPAACEVAGVRTTTPLVGTALEAQMAADVRELSEVPESMSTVIEPERIELGDAPGLIAVSRRVDGLMFETVFRYEPGMHLRVICLRWESVGRYSGVAQKVAEGMKPRRAWIPRPDSSKVTPALE